MNLLSKFLMIAKSCYEQRNFATAMQILGGLEHVAVRQSPVSPACVSSGGCGVVLSRGISRGVPLLFQAWRVLPAKVAEVLEELKAVEVTSAGTAALPPRCFLHASSTYTCSTSAARTQVASHRWGSALAQAGCPGAHLLPDSRSPKGTA